MPEPLVIAVVAALLLTGVGIVRLMPRLGAGAAARRRLDESLEAGRAPVDVDDDEVGSGLRRWLYLAGYRRRDAVAAFFIAMALALVAGIAAAWIFRAFVMATLGGWLAGMPGNLANLFLPLLVLFPWLLLITVALLPVLHVRARRRRIVREIEQDLPITLELLATLSEAGLGFGAGLTRILDSETDPRSLAKELNQYRVESLAGMPRTRCLRRLARRAEVPSVSTFVSALVQAEQMGAGLAEVMRHQADDLRNRRRERAFQMAQALPVKLVFPLVICFLPAVFVFTLGPAFHSLFRTLGSAVGGS
jgi:tight adherence protein C